MASVFTVSPETRTVEGLKFVDDNGNTHTFWLKLKKRLSVGEKRRVETSGWRSVNAERREGEGAAINIDWKSQTFSRTAEYLVDWSLTDDDKVKLPVTRETIEALHEDMFKIIDDAVTAHVAAMVEEKKARAGGAEPSAISA